MIETANRCVPGPTACKSPHETAALTSLQVPHYQYLKIGPDGAIHEIVTTEACHDRHTRNRHTSCRCGCSCIPLAAAAGDLLADAACHGPPDCATHGTGARHRRLGAGVHLTSMMGAGSKEDRLKPALRGFPGATHPARRFLDARRSDTGKKGREQYHAGFEVPVDDSGSWIV